MDILTGQAAIFNHFIFLLLIQARKLRLRLNIFSGKEKTYQAWYGVPQDSLQTHRTYNPAGTEKPGEPYDNQTDNYWQNHYQLFFNQSFNPNLIIEYCIIS